MSGESRSAQPSDRRVCPVLIGVKSGPLPARQAPPHQVHVASVLCLRPQMPLRLLLLPLPPALPPHMRPPVPSTNAATTLALCCFP